MRSTRGTRTDAAIAIAAALLVWAAAASVRAQAIDPPATATAFPSGYTGKDIFELACSTCHGLDGRGSPRSVVGFDLDLPDFTDCTFATPEPLGDWFAVIHEGGPIRGLNRHMPAFGDALSDADIEAVIQHLWTFCDNPSWPRGDLNLPRTFFIEKAFPENETIFTTAFGTSGPKAIGSEIIYEKRLGIRNQFELAIPIDMQQNADLGWSRGLGDVGVALKRALYSSFDTGRILSAGAEVVLPTGNESAGFGHGFTIFEPSVMFGQILPRGMYLQAQAGIEVPSDHSRGNNETFWRAAVGGTLAQDRGFGRAWSPAIEVLGVRETDGVAEWDVVPQLQVTLSKLQHVMIAGGVRIPVNERDERHPQVLTYLLWDWFDGSFFDFWK
jgi:mono/diheme cytochrome c family protein